MVLQRPDTVDDDIWASTLESEREVGAEYVRQGVIQRIWRVPGTTANVGLWTAADASELHRLLSALPAFPNLTIQVEALAQHYLEPT